MNIVSAPSFRQAQRAGLGLLIGIAGPSGSGKTLSALKVARGLAGGDDSRVAVIDTEAGRALHYAVGRGETPGPMAFAFQHADLRPPFTPEAYLEPIVEADAAGFRVIVIDSFSHEWDGEGGLVDIHDEAVAAAVERARARADEAGWKFDPDREAEKASIGAWKGPKLRHKRLVARLLQCRAHIVICMRAEDKLRIETRTEESRSGKTFRKTDIIAPGDLPPEKRWAPICERRLPYELATSLVLTPDAPGVPIPVRALTPALRPLVRLDRPLDEDVGAALATWARGSAGQTPPLSIPDPSALSKPQDGEGTSAAGNPPLAGGAKSSINPSAPQSLASPDADASPADWRAFGAQLRDLIEFAPTPGAAEEWWALNSASLTAASPKLAAWVFSAVPRFDEIPI